MASKVIKTYNFSLSEKDAYSGEDYEVIKDKRNNIVSDRTERFGFQSYINYLKTLQTLSGTWTNFGYFDLGMVPLAMAPIHLQQHIAECVKIHCNQNGIPYYELPGVVLLQSGFTNNIKDIWVFRSDLCNEIGYKGDPLTFSVIDYIEKEVFKTWKSITEKRIDI